jgi:hypothetical protein
MNWTLIAAIVMQTLMTAFGAGIIVERVNGLREQINQLRAEYLLLFQEVKEINRKGES